MPRMLAIAMLSLTVWPCLAAPVQAGGMPVDAELLIAADGSGSIEPPEFRWQREAYAKAITDPRVLRAIAAGRRRRIAVAYIEWGAPASQDEIVGWTLIDGLAAARGFADQLRSRRRMAWGHNSISAAIAYAATMIATNRFDGARRIIDVSGDGRNVGGPPLALVRRQADLAGITINALVLKMGPDTAGTGPDGLSLAEHFRRDVITGRGAFVIVATRRRDFAEAILRKLVREIAGLPAR
ncbi:MAG TPA: DUF1194 domain-containing protein [Alphaproteobacteria bacterium]|nr:DUF1194 domain-containing protein [Alphaproteobacteria bacterium]